MKNAMQTIAAGVLCIYTVSAFSAEGICTQQSGKNKLPEVIMRHTFAASEAVFWLASPTTIANQQADRFADFLLAALTWNAAISTSPAAIPLGAGAEKLGPLDVPDDTDLTPGPAATPGIHQVIS